MADSNEIVVSIRNLSKVYAPSRKHRSENKINPNGQIAPAEALKNINLSIPKGAIYGLLGPNGAGKSTLINIMAGLTEKTGGEVIINGIDMDKDPLSAKYCLGVVPQELQLDPFFSIYESLDYHAGYYGVPKKHRRTMELIEIFNLKSKTHESARRLSGGMKRRVLVAKAMVHNPPILILDEPTAGVDVDLRSQLWDYVRKLNRSGTTILLTTHYLEEAEKLCSHIAIINKGHVIADDTTSSLMKMLDRKQMTMRFSEELHDVPRGMEKFGASLKDNHTINFDYKASEASLIELMPLIRRAELNITDISTTDPSLEDIFRHLVNSG